MHKLEVLTCVLSYVSMPESQCDGTFDLSMITNSSEILNGEILFDWLKIPLNWLSGRLLYARAQVKSSRLNMDAYFAAMCVINRTIDMLNKREKLKRYIFWHFS